MHPAYSVILFTTASGAGYGLLMLLSLACFMGVLPESQVYGFVSMALSLGLITVGLLSSMAHLGHPERSWRAVSQWRTSWLSREGVFAIVTYVPAGIFGISWVFFGKLDGFVPYVALLTAILSVVTVYCTGMIYASLRTISAWNQKMTAPNYIIIALASGAILQVLLLTIFDQINTSSIGLALMLAATALVAKWLYWVKIDRTSIGYTVEQAIGLKGQGKIRQIEPAHTQPNYVMREMGYAVARKHSRQMRMLSTLLCFIVPSVCMVLSLGMAEPLFFASVATASLAVGLVMERWLFFAEAVHVVTLYYGSSQ
ncbi:dimethyl sulfoxide reductase anchor subunit family protein [Candidatus Puniceispirillum marinum]|uniref:DMSO reductase chain C n=1 Tax=Puniceispirillum marinum (strain IMCC1322) TaxID=488538 RepID=D5BNF7_PUNMI|nr:DmsC/YnfH family molybdoenzyme membrane anchor subunit [Candidatus Puniceispirillum marinum]ADE40350.1 DMSO reductase chain C [Candidatus Puniceispirillum marinum IMCC1322]